MMIIIFIQIESNPSIQHGQHSQHYPHRIVQIRVFICLAPTLNIRAINASEIRRRFSTERARSEQCSE